MTLIIEDGTMPEGANSYASVEDADAYWSVRAVDEASSWPPAPEQSGDTPEDPNPQPVPDPNIAQKEAALVRASDYLNTLQWHGEKISWDWPMAWPREGEGLPNMKISIPIDPDIPADGEVKRYIIPTAVKRACMELAAVFIGGENPLAPVERGGRVASETVGPISTSYFDDAADETLYPAVAGLIGPFLRIIPGVADDSGPAVFRVETA